MDRYSSLIAASRLMQKKAVMKLIFTATLMCLLNSWIVTACGPIGNGNSQSMPVTLAIYHFTFEATRPAKEIFVCDDRTGSVKDYVYDTGIQLVVRNLKSIVVHTAQGSINVTFAKIAHDSYQQETTLVADQISSVKSQPYAPVLSPFLDPVVKREIQNQYLGLQNNALASLKQAQYQATQVQTEIMLHDSKHEPVDRIGTDILGCLLKGNDLFSKSSSVLRYMVVISDLVQNIDISNGVNLHLPNVKVTVVFYCSDAAKVCYDRKMAYQMLFTRAGAQVHFEDVSQINLVNGTFGN